MGCSGRRISPRPHALPDLDLNLGYGEVLIVEVSLALEREGRSQPKIFRYRRLVNAGYVGRDQDEVRRHIEELAKKGIPAPRKTPTLYPVSCRMLTTDPEIEVYSGETSGEVEYVLLVKDETEIYVGLGSDHTDRHLEQTDIPRAKQICPNVLGRRVWPLEEVKDHWDDLVIRSSVWTEGNRVLYQEGRLELILGPTDLMNFVRSKLGESLEGVVIYSGTVGLITDGIVCGRRFEAELVDERLNRRLELAYEVNLLDYLPMDE